MNGEILAKAKANGKELVPEEALFGIISSNGEMPDGELESASGGSGKVPGNCLCEKFEPKDGLPDTEPEECRSCKHFTKYYKSILLGDCDLRQ